jgi:PleD family two-component response regulator
VAEALRYRIWSLRIPHEGKLDDPVVTVSIGIAASNPRQGGNPAMLLAEARDALKAAKTMGHGNVMAAGLERPESESAAAEQAPLVPAAALA